MRKSDGSKPDHDPAWRTLAEFSLPSVEGIERKAADLVARAISNLPMHEQRLECLKTAVAEATMNATEHGNQYQTDLPVTVKVLASESAMEVQITDYGLSGPIPEPEEPDLEAKLAGTQPARGWGFFLIQKMVDEVHVESDDAHHTIQLFLYLEGEDRQNSSNGQVIGK